MGGFYCGEILAKINEEPVIPPEDMTIKELRYWLNGYSDALINIKRLIKDMMQEQDE